MFHIEREPVGLGKIHDVNVVADARAVGRRIVGAKDLNARFLAERDFEDIGDDVRFLPVMFAKFLGASGGVKIPEANIGQAVLPVIPIKNALEHQLGFAVRIDGLFRLVFSDRHMLRYTKDGAGGGEDEFADAGLNATFEEIDAIGNVVAKILTGIGHAFRHERIGRKVHHSIRTNLLQQPEQVHAVGQIKLVKFRARIHRGTMAFAEIIENDDFVAITQQMFNTNATNVTGAAGNKNFHAGRCSRRHAGKQAYTRLLRQLFHLQSCQASVVLLFLRQSRRTLRSHGAQEQ